MSQIKMEFDQVASLYVKCETKSQQNYGTLQWKVLTLRPVRSFRYFCETVKISATPLMRWNERLAQCVGCSTFEYSTYYYIELLSVTACF